MSKPIEDSPSLVDVLAREHAARAACIAREAEALLAAYDTQVADTHVDAKVDTQVDAHADTQIETSEIVALPARASSPRILVEELTRECARRRAALDDEAQRR